MNKAKSSKYEVQMARGLALWEATALSLGVTVGLGALVVPVLAGPDTGPTLPLLFVLAGLLILPTVISYDTLSIAYPGSGGAYRLAQRGPAQGGALAFFTGWGLVFTGLAANGLLALGFAAYLNALITPWLHVTIPAPVHVAGLLLLLALLNVGGSRSQRRWQSALALLVAGGLVIVVTAYAATLPIALPALDQLSLPGSWSALSSILGAFWGLEVLALSSSEVRNLARALPRASAVYLVAGVALCAGVAYLVTGPAFPALDRLFAGALATPTLPALLVGLGLLGTLLALNTTFSGTASLLYSLARDGGLPPGLTRTNARFGTPHVALLVVAVLSASATLLNDWGLLARLTSLGVLLVTVAVNSTALRYQRREQDQPDAGWNWQSMLRLAPVLGIGVALVLLSTFSAGPLLVTAAWCLLGGVIYVAYARHHAIVAKEGVTVFAGRGRRLIQESSTYRILVPMVTSQANRPLVRQATRLARQHGGDVLALGVVSVPEQLPPEEGQRQAREKQVLMEWALAHGREAGVPLHAVTRIARDVAQGIMDAATEEHCHLILMNWADLSTTPGLSAVIQNAPCDVAAIQGALGDTVRSILVPTHGGPNTPPAVRLGRSLLDPDQGAATVLCVAPNDNDLERQVALGYIQDGLAGVDDRSRVVEQVVTAPSAVSGIVQEAQHHDAVILGASEEGLFGRLVFGDFPEMVARRSTRPVIMTKRSRGLAVFWLRRVAQAMFDRLPRLTTEQRITVYRDIRRNAWPGVNYYVLIALSCVIATLGLVVNSPAVVIGAMLVAPLMSPIMAFSLSIVLGDARLLRLAAQAAFQSAAAAIGISLFLGWLSPYNLVTAEMAARTQPTLLDLGIALASGAAGAYAIAREEVSAALPGVAIAAALMPPLSVVGLGLSMGRWDVAGGALLLFLTNLIAITLAGSLVFLGLGFRTGRMVFQFETRRGLAITVTLLALISIPLAFIMFNALQSTHLQQAIDGSLRQEISALPAAYLAKPPEYSQDGDRLVISVWVDTAQAIDGRTQAGIRAAQERDLGRPVTLRLFITPIQYQEVR